MAFLRHDLKPDSASALIALLHEYDWSATSPAVCLVVLHQINQAITKLRERSGMTPIDDALPPHANTAFLIIRELLNGQRNRSPGDSGKQ
jgi:hypothetical protein